MLATTVLVGVPLAAFTIRRTLRLERNWSSAIRKARARGRNCRSSPRGWSRPRKRSGGRFRASCTMKSASRFPRLLMEAGNAAANVPPDSAEVRRHVDSIKRLAEASVNVIRNMTLLLRPSMLDDFGLVPALEWQAREVSKRTGLRVQVSADDGAGELPDELKTCIYRVVQEALHNCARHSQARSVKVVVEQEPRRIRADAWRTTAAASTPAACAGSGWSAWRSASTHLGGGFAVRSQPGAGTKVAVELPLAS